LDQRRIGDTLYGATLEEDPGSEARLTAFRTWEGKMGVGYNKEMGCLELAVSSRKI
jgi:hypothetical protein